MPASPTRRAHAHLIPALQWLSNSSILRASAAPHADNTDEAKALHDLLERLTSGGSEEERGAAAADIAKHVQAAGAASMQVRRQRAFTTLLPGGHA